MLTSALIVAAGLMGFGLYGAMSRQSLVSLMTGIELALAGALLAMIGLWSLMLAGIAGGQVLTIVAIAVIAAETAIGGALVVAAYRHHGADAPSRFEALPSRRPSRHGSGSSSE